MLITYKLVDENPHYKGKGKLSKAARVKIVSAVRCAIWLRTGENNSKSAATKLKKRHSKLCTPCFWRSPIAQNFVENEEQHTETNNPYTAVEDCSTEENIPDVIEGVMNIRRDTVDLKKEESRGNCHIEDTLDALMIRDISLLLKRVAAKSSRLIGNYTTNLSEIRLKFDGGKLYNRCNRGSWHSRCYGESLRKNLGPQWSTKIWEKVTSTKAGKYFERLYHVKDRALLSTKFSQQKPEKKARRWKRKIQGVKESTLKRAKREYGPEAVEVIQEISEEKL
ncbi:LOW QUALITY PROTEIN: hypothetical protein KUTeg_004018 [Tegillarca granosa]|uniref:Uncharacterized protein n=1 Tax=Tegillarca granosa TaxID=220873 RepID=A0ABQ9FSJ3_TEGGR|nr:LOW QUALITY PROTEIN: hypothetical protein KUTeg_004018 [Tegillarca granosa]